MTYRTLAKTRATVEFTVDELSLGPIRLISPRGRDRQDYEEEIEEAIFRFL
jgi:hypothetical protein